MRNKNIIETIDDFHEAQRDFFCISKQISKGDPEERAKNKERLNKKYIFRGISNENQLYPSLIRKFDESNYSPSEDSYHKAIEKYEIDMLHRFEKHGSYNLEHISSVFDFLATMQHYDLPTRMIDWTRNPYTAVLFSIFSNDARNPSKKQTPNEEFPKDETDCFDFANYYYILRIDISKHIRFHDIPCYIDETSRSGYVMHDLPYTTKYIYMLETIKRLFQQNLDFDERRKLIDYIYLNTNSEYLFNTLNSNKKQVDNMKKYITKANKKLENPQQIILFVEPRYSNKRIAAQHGLFQVPIELDKDKIKQTIKTNSEILAIKKDLRLEIISELSAEGQDYYGLMPDLQGICRYAKADTDNWFEIKNKNFF